MSTTRERLKVLLFLNSLGYLRFFDSVVRLLLDRGHAVHLLIERTQHDPGEQSWLDEMEARDGFTWSATRALREGRWAKPAMSLRRSVDYVRYLGPSFRSTPYLVSRARHRAPERTRRLMDLPGMRREPLRRLIEGVFDWLERALPTSEAVDREFANIAPDVLVLSPHLMPGARHSEYVRSAQAAAIPTMMCIASWDNLSSKQRIRAEPDRIAVWNETQVGEAVEMHGLPRERVTITGAQSFDQWFSWQPREREWFCARVGLDPARPYLLYLGGSLFPGEISEARWARDWIAEVRSEPSLADVGVLLRPHPNRTAEWSVVSFADLENVTVWPPGGWQMPVDADARADFYDSMFHSAAVVGLNTSAMIEAAIVGRTVHTMLVPEFSSSQLGTLHFDYLLRVAGGLPRVATGFEEHRQQLVEALHAAPEEGARRARPFLEQFVRPHGLDRPVTPIVVDEIERVAARGPRSVLRRRPLLGRALLTAALFGARVRARAGAGPRRESPQAGEPA